MKNLNRLFAKTINKARIHSDCYCLSKWSIFIIKINVFSLLIALFIDFVVEDMMPASLTDSPRFRAWYIKSASAPYLTCRRTLMSILAECFRASRSALTHCFLKSTADCWSAHNRSFLGMTAHWIDPCDLSRKDAMLCWREVDVNHTHDILGAIVDDVHQEFDIIHKVNIIF